MRGVHVLISDSGTKFIDLNFLFWGIVLLAAAGAMLLDKNLLAFFLGVGGLIFLGTFIRRMYKKLKST